MRLEQYGSYHGNEDDIYAKGSQSSEGFRDPNNPEHFVDVEFENQFDNIGLKDIVGRKNEDVKQEEQEGSFEEPVIETDMEREKREDELVKHILDNLQPINQTPYDDHPGYELESPNAPIEGDFELSNKHESMSAWNKGEYLNTPFQTRDTENKSGRGGYAGKDNLKTMPDSKIERMNRGSLRDTLENQKGEDHQEYDLSEDFAGPEDEYINPSYKKIQDEADQEI